MEPSTDTITDTNQDWIQTTPGVEVVYRPGPWEIIAEWPQRSRRSDLTSVFRIRFLGAEPAKLVLSSTKIGLYSTTAKNHLAASMRKVPQAQVADVDLVVHTIVEHLLTAYRDLGAPIRPTPEPYPGDMFLNYPMWPAIGGTVLVAPSNSFKSFLVPAIAIQTSLGIEVLQGNTRLATQPKPIWVLDWEAGTPAFAERLYAILKGADLPIEPCIDYLHLSQPFVEVADQIAAEARRKNYGGVILDSLSAAMGASLNEDEPANLFWDAIERINTPALVTAHKNKADTQRQRKGVFGSIMHQNRPRMVWDGTRETDSRLVRWECINDNNTGHQGNLLAWRVDIQNTGEHEHRRLDTVTFTAVNPDDVRTAPDEGKTLTDQIEYALHENGPLTHGEIALILGAKPDSIKTTLHRGKQFDKRLDGRWDLTK